MTPSEKQKEIACAFVLYFNSDYSTYSTVDSYDRWILTEEGKRLTAEEDNWKVGEDQQGQAIDLLIKISEQLDRIEGKFAGK